MKKERGLRSRGKGPTLCRARPEDNRQEGGLGHGLHRSRPPPQDDARGRSWWRGRGADKPEGADEWTRHSAGVRRRTLLNRLRSQSAGSKGATSGVADQEARTAGADGGKGPE